MKHLRSPHQKAVDAFIDRMEGESRIRRQLTPKEGALRCMVMAARAAVKIHDADMPTLVAAMARLEAESAFFRSARLVRYGTYAPIPGQVCGLCGVRKGPEEFSKKLIGWKSRSVGWTTLMRAWPVCHSCAANPTAMVPGRRDW